MEFIASMRDLETAMRSEAPPPIDELESTYAEAGVSLPGLAIEDGDIARGGCSRAPIPAGGVRPVCRVDPVAPAAGSQLTKTADHNQH